MKPILNNLINLDPNRDLWNGHLIDYTNPHKVTAKQVGAATPEYVDNAIASMDVATLTRLESYDFPLFIAEEGQTTFSLESDEYTIDPTTDMFWVQVGRLIIYPNADYTIANNTLTLVEGVSAGTTIGVRVLRNTIVAEDESAVSGTIITANTMPVDRIIDGISKTEVNNLIENIQVDVTSDVPIHLSINENGGLRITYDDGSGN